MTLDPTMKALIDRAAAKRPNALAESLNLPHVPEAYFTVRDDDVVPFCGCFVGSLAIALAMEDGDDVTEYDENDLRAPALSFGRAGRAKCEVYEYLADKLATAVDAVDDAGFWCRTVPRDRAAVTYARRVLRAGR